MVDFTTNRLRAKPNLTTMPLYDGNSEEPLVQRITWTEFQNWMGMRYYLAERRRINAQPHPQPQPQPLKKVNSVTNTHTHSNDDFMMYHFKVRRCPTGRGHHDWTDCHYLHPGEKARRRDPRKYSYSGKPCADFRKRGQCESGDRCQFAHGVFETWLHPDRYKTQLCRDQANCTRKICFFAHSVGELRETDSAIEEMLDVVSPKSVLSVHQSPPLSPTDEISRGMENLRLSTVQNIANGAFNQNPIKNVPVFMSVNPMSNSKVSKTKQSEIQNEEEPNLDWVAELLD